MENIREETHMEKDVLEEILNMPDEEKWRMAKIILESIEDHEKYPEISLCPSLYYCSITVPVNGGKLQIYTDLPDDNTRPCGLCYYPEEDDTEIVDIAMAEVKNGELAIAHGMPEDNKNIELYVWNNPYTEDYTNKFVIRKKDIITALDLTESK